MAAIFTGIAFVRHTTIDGRVDSAWAGGSRHH